MCAWLPVKKTFSTSICFAPSQETLLHYQPNKIVFCILMTVILYSGGDTVIRIYMLVTVRGERVTEN